ncbi:hypothetical protein GGX14DRAFT_670546 [Mycena pura]|uniref:Uncharacterized protein n=1 Tax=Mycena pura TaxID=153505 RepID=A0AAD6VTL3_9AGAR|nr:hypothetical protein GGX14DRAFT_670546 [Mycena pura]
MAMAAAARKMPVLVAHMPSPVSTRDSNPVSARDSNQRAAAAGRAQERSTAGSRLSPASARDSIGTPPLCTRRIGASGCAREPFGLVLVVLAAGRMLVRQESHWVQAGGCACASGRRRAGGCACASGRRRHMCWESGRACVHRAAATLVASRRACAGPVDVLAGPRRARTKSRVVAVQQSARRCHTRTGLATADALDAPAGVHGGMRGCGRGRAAGCAQRACRRHGGRRRRERGGRADGAKGDMRRAGGSVPRDEQEAKKGGDVDVMAGVRDRLMHSKSDAELETMAESRSIEKEAKKGILRSRTCCSSYCIKNLIFGFLLDLLL